MLFAHRTLAASVLILCTGAAPSGYQLAWRPVEGQQIERTFALELEIDFKSGGFEVMGEEVPMEEIVGALFVDSWIQHIRGWAGLEELPRHG